MKKAAGVHPNLQAAMPIVQGVINLLYPYAEGAIHDLEHGKIAALYNNISKRAVGDPSAVTELGVDPKDFPDVFEPYYKTNWDGTKLKCVSVTVRDDAGKAVGLVCINFDTSVFQNMNLQLEKFLHATPISTPNPVERFSSDWQLQVETYIDSFTRKHSVALSAMTKDHKSRLVREMYEHNLFNYRDAASYVAKKLSVSRTTIYNYLKEGK